MNIGTKLILGISTLALAVAAVGYFSLAALQNASLNSIADDLDGQAALAMSQIEKCIDDRLRELAWYTETFSLAEQAAASNEEFDHMPNAKDHIKTTDDDWKSGRITPFIRSVLGNDLSKSMQSKLELFNRTSGYDVFPEVYVTNRYGAIIAATGITSDYYQADEPWFQEAVEAETSWLGSVEYDRSSDSFSIDLVVPLRDGDGDFGGILKAVLNIKDVRRTVEFIEAQSRYKSIRAYLIDADGRAVLSGDKSIPGQPGRDVKLREYGEDLSSREAVVEAMKADTGFHVFTEGDGQKLAVFCRSKGYGDCQGLGWSLIVEYDQDEVLHHVLTAKRTLLYAFIAVTAMAIFGGCLLSRSISRPIRSLTKTASDIAAGNADARVDDTGRKDEVGVLSRTFNQMAAHLIAANTALEKKQMELLESQQKYRSLVEATSDFIWEVDSNIAFTYASPKVKELLGYGPEEVIGKTPLELMSPHEADRVGELVREIINSGGDFAALEVTHLHKDGRHVVVEASGVPILDENGNRIGFRGISRDITQRKEAEEALRKEQRILKNLLESSDRERQLIAYEIHDGISQRLTAAKMQFQTSEHLQNEDPQQAAKLYVAGMQTLSHSIVEARRLISGVRPMIIDEMGVVSAIEHLVNDQQKHAAPRIEFASDVQFDRLIPSLENAIFRIVQESLANACRHSHSERVRIELLQRDGRVVIETRDWGTGFCPKDVREDCFGLEGIRERARLLGGHVTFDTTPGEGTRIVAELPLAEG